MSGIETLFFNSFEEYKNVPKNQKFNLKLNYDVCSEFQRQHDFYKSTRRKGVRSHIFECIREQTIRDLSEILEDHYVANFEICIFRRLSKEQYIKIANQIYLIFLKKCQSNQKDFGYESYNIITNIISYVYGSWFCPLDEPELLEELPIKIYFNPQSNQKLKNLESIVGNRWDTICFCIIKSKTNKLRNVFFSGGKYRDKREVRYFSHICSTSEVFPSIVTFDIPFPIELYLIMKRIFPNVSRFYTF